ncbi:MAG: hypothetical protein O7F11_05765 [Acidobacteria bacterium]|nr:hypothetical protein [Acidobacteriota bacterium]
MAGDLAEQAQLAARHLATLARDAGVPAEGEVLGQAGLRILRGRLEAAGELIAVEALPEHLDHWHEPLLSASRRGVQVAVLCAGGSLPFLAPAGWMVAEEEESPAYESAWSFDLAEALRSTGHGAAARTLLLSDPPFARALTRGLLARIGWQGGAGAPRFEEKVRRHLRESAAAPPDS